MKTLLLSLQFIILFIFTGCYEKDTKTLRKECLKEGKRFTTKQIFNIRLGKEVLKSECK